MKYYAVREGKIPGIYKTWGECEMQVKGYSGAQYKSFSTIEEAQTYIAGAIQNDTHLLPKTPYAFVDGSYNPNTKVYGCGGFLRLDGIEYVIQESGDDPEMADMRNVAGEIIGAMAAVRKAWELGTKELTILYDYMGIEMWATGKWKTNKSGTVSYKNYMQGAMKSMDIRFIKVKAHSGVPGNEKADSLAKQAVGIKDEV